MSDPTFTTPPTAPSRAQPATFSARMDAFLAWIVTWVGELSTAVTWFRARTDDVVAAAATAVAAAGAEKWVSGASYTAGDGVYSPIDLQTYRAKTTHSGLTDDPSTDTTNWQLLTTGSDDFALLSGATFTGPLKTLEAQETVVAMSGTTPSVDLEAGTVFTLSTTGNTTFTFANPAATGTASAFTLRITAGGAHTLTWPASVDWAGGNAPDAPASGETDVLVFFTTDGGTNWHGFQAGDALA